MKQGVPGVKSVASQITAVLLRVDIPTLYLPAVVLSLVHTVPPKSEVEPDWINPLKYPPVVPRVPREDTLSINDR